MRRLAPLLHRDYRRATDPCHGRRLRRCNDQPAASRRPLGQEVWMHVALQAAVVAAAIYLLATITVLGFIHVFQPTEFELTWISDVFLSAALGLVTWLWLHLRVARRSLL